MRKSRSTLKASLNEAKMAFHYYSFSGRTLIEHSCYRALSIVSRAVLLCPRFRQDSEWREKTLADSFNYWYLTGK